MSTNFQLFLKSTVQQQRSRRCLLVLLVLMLLTTMSGLPATAAGAIFYVDGAATGSATGDSWANAFPTLQDALQVATSGDEIWVAQGVYYPDMGGGHTDNDENASFTMPAGVKLYGGFPSGGESAGTRDWQLHRTILSGDIEQDDRADGHGVVASPSDISGRNSYHVVYLDGTATAITATTVIDGFLITAGNADGDEFATLNGGGLFCQGDAGECSPTITKVIFSGNAAGDSGGAVKNNGFRGSSSPSFVDVIFRGNSANYGGALHNDGRDSGVSSPSLVNVVFSGNSATNWGGAIVNEAGTGTSSPALTNVTFTGNSAAAGGALYSRSEGGTSSPTLINVILWQNSAPDGASFYNNNADLAIRNSVLEGGDSDIMTEGLSDITSSGNSQGDPLFVQPVDPADAPTAGGDLRLQAGSSAIDMGDSSVVPTGVATDLGGKLRIVGGTVDAGAHEFADNENAYLYFDGLTQYAEFAAPSNLPSGSAPRTVAFWLRSNLREGTDENRETILELGAPTEDGSAFGLFTQREDEQTQLCFVDHTTAQCNLAIIPDDQWHFVAITYDEPHLTTYLDGDWQSRYEISSATDGQLLEMTIDKGVIGGSPDRGWYFNGGIKHLSIWNTARSAFQIHQEMAAFPSINGNEPGLVAYYPLNDGGGVKFVDLKGASTGELINGVAWSKPIDNNPSLTAEGIWFVIQNKSDVDTDYAIPARRQALMADSNGSIVMGTMPLTGTYDAFLWSIQPLGEGQYKLINKQAGVGKALDSSQTNVAMADIGNFSGQTWTLALANQAEMGLNVYTLFNNFITSAKAVAYSQEEVVIEDSNPGGTTQAWLFQPMELALGYHIPSRPSIDYPFTKVLALAKENTLYATASTSDWAVLNAHNIYNNMMNAFADPATVPAPEARKTFYLISRHDFQPCYYAPLAATPPQCVRDNDWRGWSGDETFFSEEMMTRTGVATRGPRDTSYREFEQVVHEFGHTLDRQYFSSMAVSKTSWATPWSSPIEWYPWQVQYWFNSAQSAGANQDRASLEPDVAEYIATMFSATNTWLPPRKLRELETRPPYTFYTPGTFITAGETYKIFADEGAEYQMQLQEDGNLVISNAAGTFQWGTFNNLKVPMQDVKGIYFKNGNLYFTTTDQQSTADEWIKDGNPGVLETIHLYNEATTITARLRINPHPEGNDFLQVIDVTPGLGKTAPALLWSSHAHWSYEGEEGPSSWGELDTAYAECVNGTSQSPIDLTGAAAEDLANIAFHYQPTKLHLENNGHTIQVNYATGSYIVVDEIRYDLKQFHFHAPSENAIDGKSFPLEMHLVHKNTANQLAVVAVFLDEGTDNTVLQSVWDHLSDKVGSQEINTQVDANDFLPVIQTTYRFSGSLTTPPCTEGVSWLVMTTPVTVSSEQVEAFHRVYEGNNRPVQPLNGRDLSLDSTP